MARTMIARTATACLPLYLALAIMGLHTAEGFSSYGSLHLRPNAGIVRSSFVNPADRPASWTALGVFLKGESTSVVEDKPAAAEGVSKVTSVDDDVRKFGFEGTMLKALKDRNMEIVEELKNKYFPAYMAVTAVLSTTNYAVCYVMVDQGFDVSAFLANFGLNGDGLTSMGNAALAYAFYKALAPIRMPIGIALTSWVAAVFLSKKDGNAETEAESPSS